MTLDRRQSGEPSARPTIKAVARHAEVSHQTVSNALNAPQRLKPATLARVLRSVEELGYRPSQAARNLRTQRTRLIGFRFANSLGVGVGVGIASIEDRLLHAVCDAARDRGYGVIVFSADDDDDEIAMYADLMSRKAVDGFLLVNSHRLDPRTSWLAEHAVPFVCFGRPWQRMTHVHSWLDVDGGRGIYLAVSHLREGHHRRIGFIGWPEGSEVGADRHSGWLAATRDFRLPTRGLCARGPDGIAVGAQLAEQLLSSAYPPTALVCISDAMAVGAMHAIEQRGLAVGQDVAVVGFDDSPLATVVKPMLSSLRQPLECVAQKCIDLLVGHIEDPGKHAVTSVVEPTMIVRESSMVPAGR
jgi:DNA-binding LacI/PurR family transcriptional regulator